MLTRRILYTLAFVLQTAACIIVSAYLISQGFPRLLSSWISTTCQLHSCLPQYHGGKMRYFFPAVHVLIKDIRSQTTKEAIFWNDLTNRQFPSKEEAQKICDEIRLDDPKSVVPCYYNEGDLDFAYQWKNDGEQDTIWYIIIGTIFMIASLFMCYFTILVFRDEWDRLLTFFQTSPLSQTSRYNTYDTFADVSPSFSSPPIRTSIPPLRIDP